MTRNRELYQPPNVPKDAKLGYTSESTLCLTPEIVNGIHTHVTIHIDAGVDTGVAEEVMLKALDDFNDLLSHLVGQQVKISQETFEDSLSALNLYAIAGKDCEPQAVDGLDESDATHVTPGKVQ